MAKLTSSKWEASPESPYFFTNAGLRRNRVKYEQMGNCLQRCNRMCPALPVRPTDSLFSENCARPIA
jgi:hypothetical protein